VSTQRKFSSRAWVFKKAKSFAFLKYPSNPCASLKNKEKEDDSKSHPLFLYLSQVVDDVRTVFQQKNDYAYIPDLKY